MLVPEAQRKGFKAGQQRDGFHGLEKWLGTVAFLEIVIRYPRAQMVNVMKANIAGEPLENLWQFIERTTLQRRGRIVPFAGPLPIDALELMLHVEQPHTRRTGHRGGGQLNQQERLQTENPRQA